eukprot:scaffold86732_cov78-Phaeocystis_antarctica.AAC.6
MKRGGEAARREALRRCCMSPGHGGYHLVPSRVPICHKRAIDALGSSVGCARCPVPSRPAAQQVQGVRRQQQQHLHLRARAAAQPVQGVRRQRPLQKHGRERQGSAASTKQEIEDGAWAMAARAKAAEKAEAAAQVSSCEHCGVTMNCRAARWRHTCPPVRSGPRMEAAATAARAAGAGARRADERTGIHARVYHEKSLPRALLPAVSSSTGGGAVNARTSVVAAASASTPGGGAAGARSCDGICLPC